MSDEDNLVSKIINWWNHEHLYDVVDSDTYSKHDYFKIEIKCKCLAHKQITSREFLTEKRCDDVLSQVKALKQQPLSRFKFLCK